MSEGLSAVKHECFFELDNAKDKRPQSQTEEEAILSRITTTRSTVIITYAILWMIIRFDVPL